MKNKKNDIEESPALYGGKIPPQAVDLEESVLGALMLEKDTIIMVGDVLKDTDFYSNANKHIYAAIMELFKDEAPIDMLTVGQKLKQHGQLDEVGGPAYLALLTSKVASAVNIEYHARIIVQKAIQRKLIRSCSKLQEMAYDETVDVSDLMDSAQKEIYELTENSDKKDIQSMDQLVDAAVERIKTLEKNDKEYSGIPCGIRGIDNMTSGWQPSDLIIIAARPGVGKTSLVLTMARNMAIDYKIPVAFFSLEMSGLSLTNRLIAAETSINSAKIRKGNFNKEDWQMFYRGIDSLIHAPLYVDATPGLSVFDLRTKARRLKQKYGIKVLIVDYLQLMTAGGSSNIKFNSREQEVSIISRQLKIIAKELEIPVFALAQLNRQLEGRTDKRPMLSDLRESGSIEQDADIVTFIHRPEKNGSVSNSEGEYAPGATFLIFAKHRNGETGDVPLIFKPELTKFVDVAPVLKSGGTRTVGSKLNSMSDNNDSFSDASVEFTDPDAQDDAPF